MPKMLLIATVAAISAAIAAVPLAAPKNVASTAKPAAAKPAAETIVAIKDFAFAPPILTVKAGATLVWRNDDDEPHSIVSGDQRSGALDKGDTYASTFATPGTFDYRCGLHPFMKGKVVVTP